METVPHNPAIDFEICALLGEQPSDFIVLCLDGVQMEDFGTPPDTSAMRVERMDLVDLLNDRSENSLWPNFFSAWKRTLRKQFSLPPHTKAEAFRPVVTCRISRVCPGYSEYLHVAIRLFETLSKRIKLWSVRSSRTTTVHIIDASGFSHSHTGQKPALAIAICVRKMLQANQSDSV